MRRTTCVVDLVAAVGADSVAVGRPADGLTELRPLDHPRAAGVGGWFVTRRRAPQRDQRCVVNRTVVQRDHVNAASSQLQDGTHGLRRIGAEVLKRLSDHHGEATRLLVEVAQQLRHAVALTVGRFGRGGGVKECRRGFKPVRLAVPEKRRVLLHQRGRHAVAADRPCYLVRELREIADGTHAAMLCGCRREY